MKINCEYYYYYCENFHIFKYFLLTDDSEADEAVQSEDD